MSVDLGYLKKLVRVLQNTDPYSNKYDGWCSSLNHLEDKLTRLSDKIRKEIAKFVDN